MASSERSGKRPSRSATASRPRRKVVPPVPAETPAPAASVSPAPDAKNVAPLEGALSMVVGLLLVVAALFPRSIKQLLMLGIGGGLVFRGMTGHCGLYRKLGVNTAEDSGA